MVSSVPSRSKISNSFRNSQSRSNKINIPGICTATQMTSGDIKIDYKDGSSIIVSFLFNRFRII